MATCYRHPSRETGVSCSNCGKPICPDCMTATPVGMRCPDCAGRRQRVHTMRSMHADPTATYVLIAINVLMFVAAGAGGSWITGGGGRSTVFQDFALYGPAVDIGHDYYRLITSGFLHSGLLHIGFNMYILYWLQNGIHPAQTGGLLSGADIQKGAIIRAGHHRRPGDRQPRRPGHGAAEHRAGVRAADDRLPRDELLDGVQLAHLVAESRFAGAEGSLSVAGVRQPVREPRQPAAT